MSAIFFARIASPPVKMGDKSLIRTGRAGDQLNIGLYLGGIPSGQNKGSVCNIYGLTDGSDTNRYLKDL